MDSDNIDSEILNIKDFKKKKMEIYFTFVLKYMIT